MSKKKLCNTMADDLIWVRLTHQVALAITFVLTVSIVLIWVTGNKKLSTTYLCFQGKDTQAGIQNHARKIKL